MKARTCSRGGIGFDRLLTGSLLAILIATATPAVAQSLLMPTRSENLDGTTRDIAAQDDPTGDPSKRAWIAQGRTPDGDPDEHAHAHARRGPRLH